MLTSTLRRRLIFSGSVMAMTMAASVACLCPARAGIGLEISRTTTIDTHPPDLIVDQFPEFTTFQGGATVPFHWRSSEPNPGTVPDHFTATVWIDGQTDTTIVYFPATAEYTWEWIAPQISAAEVYLEVRAGDAFGNAASATTNSFAVEPSVKYVPTVDNIVRLAAPAPNPFNPSTRLGFNLPEPGRVALTVYDARGRRVRTLLRGNRQSGEFEARWDGRDDRGRAQPGGVYLVVLDFQGSGRSDRITQKAMLIP